MIVGRDIEFRILGPLEVLVHGRAIPLGGPKQRMLLAALLLRANEVVSVDRLIDTLWGEPPPARAKKSLQVYVWQLRKALGQDVVLTQAPGYSLALEPAQLDLHRFESLLAAALAAGSKEAAAQLRQALGLFRGPPLADFTYEGFAEAERARIEELRLRALEERIEADLALGLQADLVAELESLVAVNRMRERLRSQLMVALYRCGRQAEALAVYQEVRTLLVEELGLEPSRQLQDLQTAILRQDPALDLALLTQPFEVSPEISPAPPPPPLREQRKIVTVLAAAVGVGGDASGSADPEDARAAARPFHAAARREVETRGGVVESVTGDAMIALFGGRVAHEDDPERAVRAALALREWALEQRDDVKIWIGIDSGAAIVPLEPNPEEALAAVNVANAAQRLRETAPANGIIVGAQTYRSTRDAVEFQETAPVVTRVIATPSPAWLVMDARSPAAPVRPSAAFVGREHELDLLLSVLARVREEISPQLVTLLGVPGIGKSRLLSELHHRDDGRVPMTWRQGRCLPYGEGVSLWALGEMVKAEAGILESDGPEQVGQKLIATVAALVEEGSEREWITSRLRPLVGASLVDTAGTTGRGEAFAAWRRFLEALAEERPLVLVFEDLHWADETLLDFVDELSEKARDAPLLILCTTRPELLTRRPGWGGGKSNSLTISLQPLSDEATAALLASALSGDVPAQVRDALLERAAGNPLYAEQFVRVLAETGGLDALPETVHGIIAARLDALSPEEKELLHDAAVVGKVFWLGALEAIAGSPITRAEELLHGLQRKEFVQRARRSSFAGEAEYAFRHVLLRDVAYEQIPRHARATNHRLAATWIEQVAAGRLIDHAEFLAHHYARALELALASGATEEASELAPPTRRFLVLAGDRAFALDAAAAERYYSQALKLNASDDAERAPVLTKAAEAAWQTGRFSDAEESYEEAIALLRAAGDRLGLGEAMASLSRVQSWKGDTDRAQRLLTDAVQLLEREPPGRELALTYAEIARDRTLTGSHREGVDWAEKSLAVAGGLGLESVSAVARQYRGFARCHLGDLDGLTDLREAVDTSIRHGLGQERVRAQNNLGFCVWLSEGPAQALDLYRAAIAFGERRGADALVARVKTDVLWLLFELGEWDELLQSADELLAWDRTLGGTWIGITPLTYRACVHLYRGAVDEAAAAVDEFVARARKVGEPQLLAPALTIAARIEHARGRSSDAISLVEEFADVTADDPVYRLNNVVEAVRVCAAADELVLAGSLQKGANALMARQRHALLAARAILTEGAGREDEASELYEDAGAAWQAYGFRLEQAQAFLGVGRCRVALGRTDARAPVAAAREIFARLGARPLATESDELLARTSSADSPAARSAEET